MGWIGLHTSPNVDPHATICHWPSAKGRESVLVEDVCETVGRFARDRVELGWRGSFPFIVNALATYGAKGTPVEVAKIVPAFGHHDQVERLLHDLSPWHRSDYPISMDTLHVTNHRHRVWFEFKWIAVHTRPHVEYWRLTP